MELLKQAQKLDIFEKTQTQAKNHNGKNNNGFFVKITIYPRIFCFAKFSIDMKKIQFLLSSYGAISKPVLKNWHNERSIIPLAVFLQIG